MKKSPGKFFIVFRCILILLAGSDLPSINSATASGKHAVNSNIKDILYMDAKTREMRHNYTTKTNFGIPKRKEMVCTIIPYLEFHDLILFARNQQRKGYGNGQLPNEETMVQVIMVI
jgi:hypothetical protein